MTNIEKRTQDTNAQKLPKKLSAYCNRCKGEKIFLYFGT